MVADEEGVTDLDVRTSVLPDVRVKVATAHEVDVSGMPIAAVGQHHTHLLDAGSVGPDERGEEPGVGVVHVIQLGTVTGGSPHGDVVTGDATNVRTPFDREQRESPSAPFLKREVHHGLGHAVLESRQILVRHPSEEWVVVEYGVPSRLGQAGYREHVRSTSLLADRCDHQSSCVVGVVRRGERVKPPVANLPGWHLDRIRAADDAAYPRASGQRGGQYERRDGQTQRCAHGRGVLAVSHESDATKNRCFRAFQLESGRER